MKKSLIIISFIAIVLFVACSKEKVENINIFNIEVAKQKTMQYILRIQQNDLLGANELATKELASKTKIKVSDLPIVAYKVNRITEVKDGAYVEVAVIKSKSGDKNCDLDTWIMKVEKNNKNEYKIAEVKSSINKEIFANKGVLNSITAGEPDKEVITNLEVIPNELYPRSDEVMLNKDKIPKKEFQSVGISFDGKYIAFSTTDGKNCFIGVAALESSRPAFSNNIGLTSELTPKDAKEIFEKPIAKNIIYCDILADSKVNSFIFSEEDNALIVEYTKGKDSLGVNIYSIPDGGLYPLNLQDIFPLDKYSVEYVGSIKSEIIINVKKKNNVNGIYQELLGEYLIDLKEKTVDKI